MINRENFFTLSDATRIVEGRKKGQAYARSRRSARMKRAREYLDGTHAFCLYRGDAFFGRSKVMTGREAKEQNSMFEDAFFKTKREGARLMVWRLDHSDPYYLEIVKFRKSQRDANIAKSYRKQAYYSHKARKR